MAKRARLTREEVLDHVLFDSDDDCECEDLEYEMMVDDPYVPIADGSDDEFSDLGYVINYNNGDDDGDDDTSQAQRMKSSQSKKFSKTKTVTNTHAHTHTTHTPTYSQAHAHTHTYTKQNLALNPVSNIMQPIPLPRIVTAQSLAKQVTKNHDKITYKCELTHMRTHTHTHTHVHTQCTTSSQSPVWSTNRKNVPRKAFASKVGPTSNVG